MNQVSQVHLWIVAPAGFGRDDLVGDTCRSLTRV